VCYTKVVCEEKEGCYIPFSGLKITNWRKRKNDLKIDYS